MLTRLLNRLEYALERLFVRGAQYRLLLIAALIGLISVVGGGLVLWLGSGFGGFGESLWWAFLRLTDPGYLGDDVGTVNRILSTLLTVAGYVVFLGALVAVMTQWLNARMERLESGLTPVARNDHVLVLGWTNRTEAIVEELLRSEGRVRRFLRRHGARDLHIVVLAREVSAARLQDLRDAVGDVWDERKVTLRSGSRLRPEHLDRVDYRNAAALIVPGSEFASAGTPAADTQTVKTLLSLGAEDGEEDSSLPFTVAEIFDARKVGIARTAYPGELEVVASDTLISRLLAQNVRHPGLSHVYNEILSLGEGHEIYIRTCDRFAGARFEQLTDAFGSAVVLGVVRREESAFVPHLNPPPGFQVRESDRYVLLSDEYDATEPRQEPAEAPEERGEPGTRDVGRTETRVLLFGWNHKIPTLLREFGTYRGEHFEIVVVSTVDAGRRDRALDAYEVDRSRLDVRHVVADYTEHGVLREVDPAAFDTVLFVGSDRLRTEEESDARTVVGSLLLEEMDGPGRRPDLLLELLDPENVPLLRREGAEVLISPRIVSYMLAQVALRRELRAVFDELFTAGGAEITFHELDEYPELGDGPVTFGEIRQAAFRAGETALGVYETGDGGRVRLRPPDGMRFPEREQVQAVTMLTYR